MKVKGNRQDVEGEEDGALPKGERERAETALALRSMVEMDLRI